MADNKNKPNKAAEQYNNATDKQQLIQSINGINERLKTFAEELEKDDKLTPMVKEILNLLVPLCNDIVCGNYSQADLDFIGQISFFSANCDQIKANMDKWIDIEPFIEEEIKKPEYEGKTLDYLLEHEYKDEFGNLKREGLFYKAFLAAEKASAIAKQKKKNAPQQYTKPTSYVMPNAKLAYSFLPIYEALTLDNDGQLTFLPINDADNAQSIVVRNEKKGENTTPRVTDIVSLSYSGDLDGKAAKIKAFDQSIYNGVASFVNAGTNVFLLEDLFKVVTQKTKATPKQLETYKKSLAKFQGTTIRLDVTQEVLYHLLDDNNKLIMKTDTELVINNETIQQCIIEDALLHYTSYTIKTDKGTEKTAVEILRPPVLYEYSRVKNQIISIPVDLLEIKGKATEETIAIRDYLLHEINQLKKGYRNNSVINYEALLKHINFDFEGYKENRTAKSRITDIIISLLDGWKSKGWINDHKTTKTGKKIIGFEIII